MTVDYATIATYEPDVFRPLIGDAFATGAVTLTLVEVTSHRHLQDLESPNSHRSREPFSLLFEPEHAQAEPTTCFSPGVYVLRHSQKGEFTVAISPVQIPGRPGHPPVIRYEAVYG